MSPAERLGTLNFDIALVGGTDLFEVRNPPASDTTFTLADSSERAPHTHYKDN